MGSRLSKAIGKKTIKQNIESAPASAYKNTELDDLFFERILVKYKNIIKGKETNKYKGI